VDLRRSASRRFPSSQLRLLRTSRPRVPAPGRAPFFVRMKNPEPSRPLKWNRHSLATLLHNQLVRVNELGRAGIRTHEETRKPMRQSDQQSAPAIDDMTLTVNARRHSLLPSPILRGASLRDRRTVRAGATRERTGPMPWSLRCPLSGRPRCSRRSGRQTTPLGPRPVIKRFRTLLEITGPLIECRSHAVSNFAYPEG